MSSERQKQKTRGIQASGLLSFQFLLFVFSAYRPQRSLINMLKPVREHVYFRAEDKVTC